MSRISVVRPWRSVSERDQREIEAVMTAPGYPWARYDGTCR